ncbi:hypothetical protein SLEP1_g3919 [Rubroshorea leprosula]|uniref:Uncharacterized protein n=1 Tax=Rubroshorea leprosula TaxID=152421 RepID=A0AAV5HVR0_9ROSI|nr:hypothetical protein SLEP1_g3919 [Rubroshorea leprosula]
MSSTAKESNNKSNVQPAPPDCSGDRSGSALSGTKPSEPAPATLMPPIIITPQPSSLLRLLFQPCPTSQAPLFRSTSPLHHPIP